MEQAVKSFGRNFKEEAKTKPVPMCPRCGRQAVERTTRYGIRAECCGLHSWDRFPLVDDATHQARRKLSSLMHDLRKNIGSQRLATELTKRVKVPFTEASNIKMLNEASCKKLIAACEDIVIDIMAGTVPYAKG